MNLKQMLKDLKVTGIKLTEVAEKTGINIYTLYAITSGKQISKDKEEYIINLLYSIYNKELTRIELLKELQKKREAV